MKTIKGIVIENAALTKTDSTGKRTVKQRICKAISLTLTLCILLGAMTFVPFKAEAAYNISGGSSYSATWIIDPGHGGYDPGACNGAREEAADVLRLSLEVGRILIANGETVAFTRTNDTFTSPSGKASIANGGSFSYFVSIHRNSATASAAGVETYYATNGSSTSAKLASYIQTSMIDLGIWTDRKVKTANYTVLTNTNMPAVLLEVGFISNSSDNSKFDNYFSEIARSIAAGMLKMVGKTIGGSVVVAKPTAPKFNYDTNYVFDLAKSDELTVTWSAENAICYQWKFLLLDGTPNPESDSESGTVLRENPGMDAKSMTLYKGWGDLVAGKWIKVAVAARNGWDDDADKTWSIIYISVIDSTPGYPLLNYADRDEVWAVNDELVLRWYANNAACYKWNMYRLESAPGVDDSKSQLLRTADDYSSATELSLYANWSDFLSTCWFKVVITSYSDWSGSDPRTSTFYLHMNYGEPEVSKPVFNYSNRETVKVQNDEVEIKWYCENANYYFWNIVKLNKLPGVDDSDCQVLRTGGPMNAGALTLYKDWADFSGNTWIKATVSGVYLVDSEKKSTETIYVYLDTGVSEAYLAPKSGTGIILKDTSVCTGVSLKCDAKSFLSSFEVRDLTIRIVNPAGNDVTGFVGTGCRLNVYDTAGKLTKAYTLIVKFDVDGNGILDVTDYLLIKRYHQKLAVLTDVQHSAGDVDGGGEIDQTDYLKMKRSFQGLL